MGAGTAHERARRIALAAAVLLVGDLFLGWHRVTLALGGGALSLQATSTGWHGWGVVAGAGALLVAVLTVVSLQEGPERPVATLVAGLTALGGTALAVFAEEVDVRAPTAAVRADVTLWPGWVGLALAVVVAAATLVAYRTAARPSSSSAAAMPPESTSTSGTESRSALTPKVRRPS